MKHLEIVKGADNPILRAVSEPVKYFDADLKRFVGQMERAMVKAKGIGIAAPQVGKNVRVFLAVLDDGKLTVPMVNPAILEFSEEVAVAEEGCLSLPGVYGNVERSLGVKMEFFTLEGARVEVVLEELNARVVQHELDHLDGVLIVDKFV